MAFADNDFGQVSPEVGVGMKVGTIAATVAFGPIGGIIGGFASLITSLLGGGEPFEVREKREDQESAARFNNAQNDIINRGAIAYWDYVKPEGPHIAYQLMYDFNNTMDLTGNWPIISEATERMDSELLNKISKYLPGIEAIAVLTLMERIDPDVFQNPHSLLSVPTQAELVDPAGQW